MELWADDTGWLTVQKGKNQVEPQTVAGTVATARSLEEARPDDTDPEAQVFGLTGEAPPTGCAPLRRPLTSATDSTGTAAESA